MTLCLSNAAVAAAQATHPIPSAQIQEPLASKQIVLDWHGNEDPLARRGDPQVAFVLGSVVMPSSGMRQSDELSDEQNQKILREVRSFLVSHTEASGSPSRHPQLSSQRATAVGYHLLNTHEIAPGGLLAQEHGSAPVANPRSPTATVN